MALRRRVVQTDLLTGLEPFGSDIPAPTGGDIPAPTDSDIPAPTQSITDAGDGSILAASQASVILTSVPVTVTQEKTVVATPTSTGTASPTATPAHAHGGLAAGAIAGIVVAVVLVLMIPAAFLIWRSHQMKKEEQWRASQRSSQEAMIVKESAEPKRDVGPPPPRPRRSPSDAPRERPTNSLGLFNFDLGSPSPAPNTTEKTPNNPKGGPRLSIARTLQMRRSEVSVVNQERRSQQQISDLRNGLRNNPPTNRNSRENPGGSSPPPPYGGAPAADSKFAPLNNIGTAVSGGRPKFNRNGSSSTIPRQISPTPQDEMPRPRTATGPRQPPSREEIRSPKAAASPQQSSPGTQEMRQGPRHLTSENLASARITDPRISAYSMSNYHDSLPPQPPSEPKLESTSDQPTLEPPEPAAQGRTTSPVPRSISPVNKYQLPTFGFGNNDRFSWGVGSSSKTNDAAAEKRKKDDLERKKSTKVERSLDNHMDEPIGRRSDVSNLSYDPVEDNRKSNGRAISPVESDEDFGMRTRQYP